MKPTTFSSYLDYLPKLKLHYITVPSEIVQSVGGVGSRLMCSIEDQEAFHAGMVALGGGEAYITINKKRMKAFGIAKGDQVRVTIRKDTSKYGMEMPEELEALLEQDDEGRKRFEQLTPGKKRYIIHYVSQVKNSQLKIDRAILLINNLKELPEGEFDFRKLLGLPPREE